MHNCTYKSLTYFCYIYRICHMENMEKLTKLLRNTLQLQYNDFNGKCTHVLYYYICTFNAY